MEPTRRDLLKAGAALGPAALLGFPAAAEADSAPDVLKPYGLDLFTVYRKMFASAAPKSTCLWWYFGVDHMAVDGMGGDVPVNQVDCMMAYRTEMLDPDTMKILYRERGCFRDIATGEIPKPWRNPVDGEILPRAPSFVDGPGTYIVHKTPAGVDVSLEQATATGPRVAVTVSVADGQVCLTQTEDKLRPISAPRPIQSVLKIYAGLDVLRDPKILSADASGFYSTGLTETPMRRTRGLMRKTALGEKLNPVAWQRIKAAYPKAFEGDVYDPWGDDG
jgi:hypothetical protein